MTDMFKELLEKKKGKKMDPVEKEAKMSVLKEIKGLASGEMGEELKGLKKVTVAAPDSEGLKQGLDKAEELVEGASCEKCSKEPCECEASPESSDEEEMSPEEIDTMIAMLQAKKAKSSPKSE